MEESFGSREHSSISVDGFRVLPDEMAEEAVRAEPQLAPLRNMTVADVLRNPPASDNDFSDGFHLIRNVGRKTAFVKRVVGRAAVFEMKLVGGCIRKG